MSSLFDVEIAAADARDAQVFAEQKAAAAAKKLHQEQVEQQQAATAAARRQKLAAEAARENLVKNIKFFADRFIESVRKAIAQYSWSSAAIKEVEQYCLWVLRQTDVQEPQINQGLAQVVQDRFTYGLFLAGDKIPSGFFVGQRQEWYGPLFAKKAGLQPEKPARLQYGGTPLVAEKTPPKQITNVTELRPAITPKGTKGGRPGSRQLGMTG